LAPRSRRGRRCPRAAAAHRCPALSAALLSLLRTAAHLLPCAGASYSAPESENAWPSAAVCPPDLDRLGPAASSSAALGAGRLAAGQTPAPVEHVTVPPGPPRSHASMLSHRALRSKISSSHQELLSIVQPINGQFRSWQETGPCDTNSFDHSDVRRGGKRGHPNVVTDLCGYPEFRAASAGSVRHQPRSGWRTPTAGPPEYPSIRRRCDGDRDPGRAGALAAPVRDQRCSSGGTPATPVPTSTSRPGIGAPDDGDTLGIAGSSAARAHHPRWWPGAAGDMHEVCPDASLPATAP